MKYPRQIDYEPGTLITIDDVFGYYQSPFVNVVESLVQGGHANEAEYGSKRSSGWADALSSRGGGFGRRFWRCRGVLRAAPLKAEIRSLMTNTPVSCSLKAHDDGLSSMV